MKSVPMIKTAPSSASTSPRQKAGVSVCLRISQAPNATHSGAVFPSKVALDTVVKATEAVHKPRSRAVKSPASRGNTMERDWIAGFALVRDTKNGSSENVEKKRR